MKVRSFVLVTSLVIAAAAGGFYVIRQLPPKSAQGPESTNLPSSEEHADQVKESQVETVVNAPQESDNTVTHSSRDSFSRTCDIAEKIPTDVSWKSFVVFSEPKEIFNKISTDTQKISAQTKESAIYDRHYFEIRFFEFGSITSGPYKGAKLIVSHFRFHHYAMEADPDRYGFNYQRFLLQNDHLIQLTSISEEPDDPQFFSDAIRQLNLKYSTKDDFNIPLFQTPLPHIELNGTCLNFSEQLPEETEKPGAKVGTHPFYGDFYFGGNYFHVKLPDGTILSYYYLPPPELDFMGGAYSSASPDQTGFRCFSEPGKRETTETPDQVFFNPEIKDSELKELKSVPGLGKIYVPKDDHHHVVESLYKTYQNELDRYKQYQEQYVTMDRPGMTEILSHEEYVKRIPAFFWKDPFGRLVRCENTGLRVPSLAEPLIYLYPQAEEKIEVRIDKRVHIYESIPQVIENGWIVKATPAGKLTFVKDGSKFQHLYWEGKYSPIQPPTRGFVVSREAVDAFLKEKLETLGLNEKESKDFRNYWTPKLNRHPFYLIAFLDTATINNLAPLDIKPRPDTIIRVMMDFAPLDSKIDALAIQMPSVPTRTGFTVVEWGGIIR